MCKRSTLHTSGANNKGWERSEGFYRIEFLMTNQVTCVQMENKNAFSN